MSTTNSITSEEPRNRDDYRDAIVLWIARFGASRNDLLTRFGLHQEPEVVDEALLWALEEGYVQRSVPDSSEAEFYLPTSMGLIYASETSTGAYLKRWIGHVDLLKARGEVFNRAVASVAAAVAVKFQSDLADEDGISMLDEWQLRALGRTSNKKYRFATSAPVGGRHLMRLPPIILREESEPQAASEVGESDECDYALPVVIEVLTADKDEAEIRNILANRNNRNDLSRVMCYVASECRGVVLKVIREVKGQKKLLFYQMPEKIEADALVELNAEFVGDAVTEDISSLTEEQQESLEHIVMCVYHFEMVSVLGIADYLEIEEWYVTELVKAAVEAKLLKPSQELCDGVLVYSVTQDGVEFLKEAGWTANEQPSGVTITGAREAKDRLRIAARLAKRKAYAGCVVMSPVQLHDKNLTVPSVTVTLDGRLQPSYADLTILRARKLGVCRAVAIITSERDSLESAIAILRAWAQDPVEEVMFFASQALLPGLKSFARELGVYGRVKIKGLPEPENAVSATAPEIATQATAAASETDDVRHSEYGKGSSSQSGHTTSIGGRKATRRTSQRREKSSTVFDAEIADREMEISREDEAIARLERKLEQLPEEASKRYRLDITHPGVEGFEPINDAAALEYKDVLRLYEVDTSRWQISWRLLVNIAILLIERGIPVQRINTETFKVSRETFEKKVYEMYEAGAWQLLPEIVEASEADLPKEEKRPKLDWTHVDPEKFEERIRYRCNVRSHFDSDFLGRLSLDKLDGLEGLSNDDGFEDLSDELDWLS